MKHCLLSFISICLLSFSVFAQSEIITVFEAVKIKNDTRVKIIFYYENNWRELGFEAIKKGCILSFEIIQSKADEKADFVIALITRYSSKPQFEKAEENFQQLIKQSGKLKLLNNLKPSEFRENLFVKTGTSKFTVKNSKVFKNKPSSQYNSADLKFFDFLLGKWKGKDATSKIATKRILIGCGTQEFWEEKESDSDQIFSASLIKTYNSRSKGLSSN